MKTKTVNKTFRKRLGGNFHTFLKAMPAFLFVLAVYYVWHIGAVSPAIKSSVLTFLGGGTLLLLGQFVQKAVMEPFQEMQRTFGEVGAALIVHARSAEKMLREDLQQEARTTFRKLAGDLAGKRRAAGYYGVLADMEFLPQYEDVKKAIKDLVFLSNSVGTGNDIAFSEASDRIKEALRIDF